MKNFKFGPLAIDPVELGSRGNAVLGIRDSGKTVTAKVLAEHLYDAGIPLVVFDPSGTWRHLRVPGHGKGRPVVVAGGREADLPLTPASAPKIVEAALHAGLSLVLHLDLSLSKTDWRAIVRDSVRLLMQRNAEFGLRHVILEEAAEFVPQVVRGDIAVVYAEVERLVRIGGNAGLGCTLVNQRAEEVNKAVLELCDNLFLHRQKGRNSLTALGKWLDIGAVKDGKAVTDSLSTLPSGQCWAWLHGSDQPVLVSVPMCDSFHPNRRELRSGAALAKLKAAVPMDEFVEKLRAQLPQIEEERKANDPAALRAEIRRLTAELAKKTAAAVDQDAISRARQTALTEGMRLGFDDGAAKTRAMYGERIRAFVDTMEAASKALLAPMPHASGLAAVEAQKSSTPKPTPASVLSPQRTSPAPLRQISSTPRAVNGSGELIRGERAILTVLAQFSPQALDRARLGAIAGFASKGGSFRTYVGRLKTLGYVERDALRITAAGLEALGPFDPMPTGRALLDHWCARLIKGEREILQAVVNNGGEASRDHIGQATGFEPSGGSFRTYVGKLKTLGLLTGSNPLQLHEDLR